MMALGCRKHLIMAMAACAVIAVAICLAPETAWANPLGDFIIDKISDKPDTDLQGSILASATNMINGISVTGLTETFKHLLGDSYGTVKSIFGKVSKGFGYSVLVVVYLVQLVKIATHMEGNAQLPGLKETLTLLVFFVIFKHLIDCSLDYIEYIYNEFNLLTIWIGNQGSLTTNQAGQVALTGNLVTEAQMRALLNEDDGTIVQVLEAAVVWVSAFVLQFAAYFSVLARSLQAYVLAIFAPIPIAFLGLDDTRSWGIGYLKNFVAICLAGCLIMVIIVITPHVLSAAIGIGLSSIIPLGASCFVCVFAMFKAGGWSRDILGG